MKIFYDCEFHERGSQTGIEFVSIGMVDEGGNEYYAINRYATWWAIYRDEWLRDNVLAQLPGRVINYGNGGGTFEPDESSGLFKSPGQIRDEVSEFCYQRRAREGHATPQAELWADYGAYDHVVVANLFGRMVDLPPHMPMFTFDIQQAAHMLGVDLPIRPGDDDDEHNALADARWVRTQHRAIETFALDHWWLNV